jgi:MerR family transcriptional regulator, mercuric resistance operon regulatory protein
LYDNGFEQRPAVYPPLARTRLRDRRDPRHLDDHRGANCVEVKEIIRGHLADIRDKFADLKKLERVLTRMASLCAGNQLPGCPVLDALSKA